MMMVRAKLFEERQDLVPELELQQESIQVVLMEKTHQILGTHLAATDN